MKKQHMKKALVSALAFVMVFGLAACGGKSSNKSKHDADTISVCIASEPETMDPARNSTVDGGTMTLHLFSGLAKWDEDKDGKPVLKKTAHILILIRLEKVLSGQMESL